MIKYDVTLYFKRPLQTYNYNFVSSTNSHESISTVRGSRLSSYKYTKKIAEHYVIFLNDLWMKITKHFN